MDQNNPIFGMNKKIEKLKSEMNDHERIKLEFAISQLEQHIVHPMKPGYRRHDILDKIKELKLQLEAL